MYVVNDESTKGSRQRGSQEQLGIVNVEKYVPVRKHQEKGADVAYEPNRASPFTISQRYQLNAIVYRTRIHGGCQADVEAGVLEGSNLFVVDARVKWLVNGGNVDDAKGCGAGRSNGDQPLTKEYSI